ncbi:MAG TPA: BlaI/MecI/CopY family transcriptional regulator [Leptolyngbyaceae cyanobacterium M65_K2018_010]|nr:BlaI/MecI/CopY family transcriptional regulator [Leptolyngbyaceae cyanobacterium M65_K2018_010]
MSPLPRHRPRQLSLGPLEQEILAILWAKGEASVKAIQDHILADPDRDLTQASITTVLQRLARKGWVRREGAPPGGGGKARKGYLWKPEFSQQEATVLNAHQQLQDFLAISSPDVVAAFADSLDDTALERLDAIAQRLRDLRRAQEQEGPCT